MIRTIYFDLGNVLVFFSHPKMMRQISSCTGLSVEELEHYFFKKKWLHLYETGQIDTLVVFRMFQALSPRSFSLPQLLDAASDIFTPNEEIWPLVESLKKGGLRLIILSNTSECHFNRVSSDYPILKLFDHRILSYEVGALKPDPLIYQKALNASNCSPGECFYTDDVPAFIEGAIKVGIDGEVFTDVPHLRSQLLSRGLNFLA